MNRIQRIRRLAGVLAGLACALVAFAAAAPAALASVAPPPGGAADAAVPLQFLPPGWNNHPPPPAPMRVHTHTIVIHTVTPGGGMPGWQITLIVGGAALLAATVAVLLDRARAAYRKTITAATPARPADSPLPPQEIPDRAAPLPASTTQRQYIK